MRHRLSTILVVFFLTTAAFAQQTSSASKKPLPPQPIKVTKGTSAKPATTTKPAAPQASATTTSAVKPVQPAPNTAPVLLGWVNGSPISKGQLDQVIASRWGGLVMRQIIEDRLVRQEARRQGVKATPEEVQGRYLSLRDKYSTDATFLRSLHSQGITPDGIAEKLTTDILLEKLLAKENTVSEADIRQYYDTHQSEYQTPAEVHLFGIVSNTIEEAYLVRERLARGDKLDIVASELSQDPSKEKGGDMGWKKASDLPDKAFADAVFGMDQGMVSKPLRSADKYYVIMVRERKPEQTIEFSKAQKGIKEKLLAEKSVTRDEYVRNLARRAEIVIDWTPVQYLTGDYASLKQIQVRIDEDILDLTEAPVRLTDGSIMIPAKPVLSAIGAQLEWKADTQTLIASTPSGRVKLTIGSPLAVTGTDTLESKDMKEAPVMRNGTLFIAPRVALGALGAEVTWDGINNTLVITTPQQSMPSPLVPPLHSGLEKQK